MRLGSHLTVEQKTKDALWHTGRPQSPESKAKISVGLRGRPCSPETRAKISASEKGKSVPEGFGAQISALLKGRKLSAETRAKMSLAGKTLPRSEGWLRTIGRKGKESPSWKGGITSISASIRTSNDYLVWRETVFVHDSYTCQKCGRVGGAIVGHHMDCFADFPEKRMEVDNGITFCFDCHREFHRRYGKLHNRKWQTVEFLSEVEKA